MTFLKNWLWNGFPLPNFRTSKPSLLPSQVSSMTQSLLSKGPSSCQLCCPSFCFSPTLVSLFPHRLEGPSESNRPSSHDPRLQELVPRAGSGHSYPSTQHGKGANCLDRPQDKEILSLPDGPTGKNTVVTGSSEWNFSPTLGAPSA